jgi:hypothetical protein
VFVRRLFVQNTTGATETVARLTTADRVVTIPSGIMKSGQHYVIHVVAVSSAGPVPPPIRATRPFGRADAFSAVLTVP